jgi:hypothetical protein
MMLWPFVLHILLVVNVRKLVNMWLMKTSWISDGGTNTWIPQWFWCNWEWRSATSSQHDYTGAIPRHPNWGDAPALADVAADHSTAVAQSPWGESWWPAPSIHHQLISFFVSNPRHHGLSNASAFIRGTALLPNDDVLPTADASTKCFEENLPPNGVLLPNSAHMSVSSLYQFLGLTYAPLITG